MTYHFSSNLVSGTIFSYSKAKIYRIKGAEFQLFRKPCIIYISHTEKFLLPGEDVTIFFKYDPQLRIYQNRQPIPEILFSKHGEKEMYYLSSFLNFIAH